MLSSTYEMTEDADIQLLALRKRYLELLRERWTASGLRPSVAGFQGEDMAKSRMFGSNAKPTLKAAIKLRNALVEAGIPMPPPAVAIEDDEDFEWIALGRRVRKATPDKYREALRILKELADAVASVEESPSLLADLVPKRT